MRLLLGAVALLLLCSCGLMSPQQQSDALLVIDQMLGQGSITAAQHAALREAILSGGQAHWWQSLVEVAAGAALGYFGVQIRRGPPTKTENIQKALAAKHGQQPAEG